MEMQGTNAGLSMVEEARAEASTTDLLRELVDETRQLARAEIALARDELRREIQAARRGAIALGVTAVLALQGLALLLVALATACPHPVLAAALLGGGLLVFAGIALLYGYRQLPLRPLSDVRERLKTDVQVLKDQVA